jgi:uncharacterized membrane protein
MDNLDPTQHPENYKWGMFYFNSQDDRIIVRKRLRGFGWTLNFARPESYFILLLFFAAVFFSNKYKSVS